MSVPVGSEPSVGYAGRLAIIVSTWTAQLVRLPSQPNHAEAKRRLIRHALTVAVGAAVLFIVLMTCVDAWEIAQMPPRGTPSLWPFRVATDFGEDSYVMPVIVGLLLMVTLVAPAMHGPSRRRWLAAGVRLQFLLLALALPLVVGEILKWSAGRGRPFVGGHANPFNFAPFTGTGAYSSFPSAHSITAFAVAFAVAAMWPRLRGLMMAYALVILVTRLVLLAHHPSDVVAGATVGLIGAMFLRYWFAVRGLIFSIDDRGVISPAAPKGVAAGRSAS
jgi:undecaprenyl-diphosphatase